MGQRHNGLSPSTFSNQAAYAAWSAECIARLGLTSPYGVIDATFEPESLRLGRLQARHLHVRFQDGTLIDTDNADALPPVLSLESESQAVTVVLALPLLRANGGNCLKPDEVAERPVRYRQRWPGCAQYFWGRYTPDCGDAAGTDFAFCPPEQQ